MSFIQYIMSIPKTALAKYLPRKRTKRGVCFCEGNRMNGSARVAIVLTAMSSMVIICWVVLIAPPFCI